MHKMLRPTSENESCEHFDWISSSVFNALEADRTLVLNIKSLRRM